MATRVESAGCKSIAGFSYFIRFMSVHYDRFEDIPSGTAYAVTDRGELHMLCSGNPDAWMSASLNSQLVSSNTQNNR